MDLLVDEIEGTVFADHYRVATVHAVTSDMHVMSFVRGGMVSLEAQDWNEALEEATEVAIDHVESWTATMAAEDLPGASGGRS